MSRVPACACRPDAQLASARQPSKSHHQQEAPSRGQSRAAPLQLADHGRDRARDSQHRSTDRDRARDSDRLRSGSQHRERQSTRQERLARGRQQTREPHRSADSNREHATSNRERDRQREREGAREGHANRQTGSRTERDIKKEGDRGQNRAPKKADPRPGPAARGEQAERAPVQQPAAQQRYLLPTELCIMSLLSEAWLSCSSPHAWLHFKAATGR